MKTTTRSNGAGFTLVELVIMVGVICVVTVTAVAVMPNLISQSKADGSTAILVNALRLARDRAIGERRNMDVIFTAPNKIEIAREEIDLTLPVGYTPVKTVIMTVFLEGNQKFMYYTGMGDTGDAFGLTNKPLAFGAVVSASTPVIMFTSEGTLVDATGDSINGTVFLGAGAERTSARAVTIFGTTALVRSWKWDGVRWAE